MRLIKTLAIVLIVLVAVLGVVGLFLPSEVNVERHVRIDAPPAEVYAVVSDFSHFNAWSPWHAMDPDATYTMSGTPGTVGSRMTWASDKPEVGAGSQTVTALTPPQRVEVALDFGEQGAAESYYRLTPADGGTDLTWGFDVDLGGNPYMHYFALVMDSMLGPDYERGLEELKRYIEGGKHQQ